MILIGQDIGMLERSYPNYIKISHEAFEFVFLHEFGLYYPENDRAEQYAKIITRS